VWAKGAATEQDAGRCLHLVEGMGTEVEGNSHFPVEMGAGGNLLWECKTVENLMIEGQSYTGMDLG
jgi:hypothetical protein